MPTSILVQLLLLFTALAVAFALWKGRVGERLAAVAVLVNMVVALVAPISSSPLMALANDAVAATALLLITMRYGSPWMGGVMLFYAGQFALHSFYLVTDRPPNDYLHALLNNLCFSGVTWCLVIGTAVAWRQRVRMTRVAAQPAP